ncbi:MAG: hypothetical protein Fur002_08960 [Anaerolineales bacterium]
MTIDPTAASERLARNARAIITIILAASLPTAALFGYYGIALREPGLLTVVVALVLSGILGFNMMTQARLSHHNFAMSVVMTNFIITVALATFFTQGLGVIIASATLLLVIISGSLAMSPKYILPVSLAGVLASAALFILDGTLPAGRLQISGLERYTPYIVLLMGIGFAVHIAREFNRFSLRAKVALGILLTGGAVVSALVYFGLNRANRILDVISNRYEQSVNRQIESEISAALTKQASQISTLFDKTQQDLILLTQYRANLETRRDTLGKGEYWNAAEKVFQFTGGQYGNIGSDPAAVFIPNTRQITPDDILDLNTTAYLDFSAPNFLEKNPQAAAVYYISKTGSTTYYPNIKLALVVPPDFDPLSQPFYAIAAPQNNPERAMQWTRAYQDPAGAGLVVTLSAPVYAGDSFLGVMGADVKLTEVVNAVARIKIGKTGYAFLVDDGGYILAMPPAGYLLFGLQPETVPVNESPRATIVGRGSSALQQAAKEIMSGETRVMQLNIDNEATYIVSTPIEKTNYHLAAVIPAAELNAAIQESRASIEADKQSLLRNMLILLFGLFIGGLAISLGVGQVISAPLTRLTKTVEQIAAGDLSARAKVATQDETGVLANAFNSMADNLQATLTELEERASERTNALEEANKNNIRRATRFEAVARVASAISSSQTLDALLNKITESISAEFGFYHVGMFLADQHREYAVLVAANSEGGKRMLMRNHRLRVGGAGIVGYVTYLGQPRVALDVGQDAVYFNNPDLPDTHSEIALPLRIGTDIFGALDVQSTEVNAFTQEDINILSILADQVSVAVQNARSYQQSVEALAQAEKASYELSAQQWQRFLEQKTTPGYIFDGIETRTLTAADKTRAAHLHIPLMLRGAQIGSIKVSSIDANKEWSEDEETMLRAAAERAALALENARLLYESQKRAAKERAIGDISAKIGGSTDIETILQTAIQELGSVLPGVNVAVQFTDEAKK